MKVGIGYRLQKGPWGGGNQFARSLSNSLQDRGHEVYFDLGQDKLDIILLTDPRWWSPTVSFGSGSILRYLLFRNWSTLVVHRINECDERKGTRNMNRLLRWGNYCADHTVFIASWLKELELWQGTSEECVILNGADHNIFQRGRSIPWNGRGPLKLVTHHWGGNPMKGFDIYSLIDSLLSRPEWRDRIDFTYIGNLPNGYRFRNARYVPALEGDALARELSNHHVYVTASKNEPAGMHHIEGALSGLPLLYRRSGALPEYCCGFGVDFDDIDFIPALESLIKNYACFKSAIESYPYTADLMCAKYISLFEKMVADRELLLRSRGLWRSPLSLLRNLIIL